MERVLSPPNAGEVSFLTNNQAHARTAMLCQTMYKQVMAQRGYERQQAILAIQ
jgi:hypothetical protein